MHFLLEFLKFVGIFFLLIVFVSAVVYIIHIHPTEEYYLKVLSFTEWKTHKEIRSELEKMLNGKMIRIEVYFGIALLIHDGIIEEQITKRITEGIEIKEYKYRKKTNRRRKKIESKEQEVKPFDDEWLTT